MLSLPLPCRYEDLTLAADRGMLPVVALFVDVSADAVADALIHWRELLPTTQLKLLAAPFNREQVELFLNADGNATLVAVIADNFDDAGAVKEIDCPVWATCAPYDSSGVHVKIGIEKSLVTALLARAVFLVHDPAHKVIRQFDRAGLHDRVTNRAWRKAIYQCVWKAAAGVAWMAARLSSSSK